MPRFQAFQLELLHYYIRCGSLMIFQNMLRQWVRFYGVLLLTAAGMKAYAPKGVITVLRFDGVPGPLLPLALWAVIVIEILVGSWLAVGKADSRLGNWSGLALAFVLCVQQSLLLIAGESRCGCFGSFGDFFSPGLMAITLLSINVTVGGACAWTLRAISRNVVAGVPGTAHAAPLVC